MKKMLTAILFFTALLTTCSARAQSPGAQFSRVGGFYYAAPYSQWRAAVFTGNSSTGSQTIIVCPGLVVLSDGRQIQPFSTNASITIDFGPNQETVTPSAVSLVNPPPGAPGTAQCASITATFANTHGPTLTPNVFSGTFGLQEAINDANIAGGGIVVVDAAFGGSTATLTSATFPSKNVNILDLRGAATGPVVYTKSGANYGQAPNTNVSPVLSGSFTGTATAASIGVATQTVMVTGVNSGDTLSLVSAPAPTSLCPLTTYRATAANTVSLDFAVLTAAACTPATGTYKFMVIR